MSRPSAGFSRRAGVAFVAGARFAAPLAGTGFAGASEATDGAAAAGVFFRADDVGLAFTGALSGAAVSGVFFSDWGLPAAAFTGVFRAAALAAFTGAFALGSDVGAVCLPGVESGDGAEVSLDAVRFFAIYPCVFLRAKNCEFTTAGRWVGGRRVGRAYVPPQCRRLADMPTSRRADPPTADSRSPTRRPADEPISRPADMPTSRPAVYPLQFRP